MAELRVGLIGFGLAGRVFHAPLIEAVDGMRLSAVVTSRAEEVRARHPRAEILPDPDGLWSRSDLVVVATPNRTHAPLALEALRQGKPVVVDKPLAASADEAEGLVRRACGGLTVFQNRRWDGDFLTVRGLVETGALGFVHRFESRFTRFRPEVQAGAWRERADPAEGGGLLLDLGAHLVDQAIRLFGPVRAVHAELDRRRPGAQVEDDAFLALEHGGEVRSHLWMSSLAPSPLPRFALQGTAGGFACDGIDPQEAQLREGFAPGDAVFGGASAPGRYTDRLGTSPHPIERGDYAAFYRGVLEWLRRDAAPPVEPADAVAVLRVLDAARVTARAAR